MSKEITSCAYYDLSNKTEWKIFVKNNDAQLMKSSKKQGSLFHQKKKKQLDREYLQCLDIFFNRYDFESWNNSYVKDSDSDVITIECSGENYFVSKASVPQEESGIFEDLLRYFTACFDGTAKAVCLSFHSYDGGGPEFKIEVETKGIFTWFSQRHYSKPDHERLCGAGYSMNFYLYPLRPGKATALITADSPICHQQPQRLFVEVDNSLNIKYRTEDLDYIRTDDEKMKKLSFLNGAWEPKYEIGTRIEIDFPNITVLWRNSPVLCTTVNAFENANGVELCLKHNGLRYESTATDYAEVRELFYSDGKLNLTKSFPITGESRETLVKTENSRYGNYTIVDEILKVIEGHWEDEEGFCCLDFSKNTLSLNDRKIKIHVLHSNYEGTSKNKFKIVNEDPSVYSVFEFEELSYIDGAITGSIMICDSAPHTVTFKKVL